MKPIFTRHEYNDEIQKYGYVKFPLLDNVMVGELQSLYEFLQIDDEIGFGYNVGMNNSDFRLRKEMQSKILGLIRPKIEPMFVDRTLYTATFMAKAPNGINIVPPHQDWTYTNDEHEHPSIMGWLTLDDTDKSNGALGFIKGSHLWFDYVRGFPVPEAPTPVERFKFELVDCLEILPMKAGEVVFFNNKTVHGSLPNRSSSERLAIGFSARPLNQQIVTYLLAPRHHGKKVLKYEVDDDFFVKYNNLLLTQMYNDGFNLEGYALLGTYDYDIASEVGLEELHQLRLSNG